MHRRIQANYADLRQASVPYYQTAHSFAKQCQLFAYTLLFASSRFVSTPSTFSIRHKHFIRDRSIFRAFSALSVVAFSKRKNNIGRLVTVCTFNYAITQESDQHSEESMSTDWSNRWTINLV